jgi:C4-type Zn-finger protein
MPDILGTVSTVLGIVRKVQDASAKIHDAELKNLVGDLSLKVAELKVQLANMIDENTDLKGQVKTLQQADGEPCPRCRKRTWAVIASAPHPMFGDMGALLRTYRCSECGFSEEKIIKP